MKNLNFYSLDASNNQTLRMIVNESGNVGIGTSIANTRLAVAGDISFNGNLYQNGTLFTGGSTINETTDVSLNNLLIHGDLSANDASFNVIDISAVFIQGRDLVDGAPDTLNTLNKLAAALDNSANFATNVTADISSIQSQLDTKQDTITDGDLTIAFTNGLQSALDSKHPLINETTDVSLNNLLIHGDLSANDASFNVIDASSINTTGTSYMHSIIPAADNAYSLGDPSNVWKDVYIGPGSLYIDGQKVLESDANTIVVGADENQNLKINTHGSGVLQMEAASGIQITSTGSGNIELGSTGSGIVRITDNLALNGNIEIYNDSTNTVKINDSLNVTGDYLQNGANINTIYATLASPTLTGTPLAPTATSGTNTTQIATTAFVASAVSNLVNSAPAALDTLSELAAALDNSANFATNVTTTLGDLQTQINAKQDTVSTDDLAITDISGLTASLSSKQSLLSTSNRLDATLIHDGTVTNTEFGYLDGVTSAIQTQLDSKTTASSTDTFTNKTIDVDATGNSITNLANANIKAAAGIEYSKLSIADADLTIAKTSGLQAALDAKQATITTDDLAITDISGLTASLSSKQSLLSTSNRLDATLIHDGTVTNTEFGYLNGVTSAIQTQLDSKTTASSTDTFTNKTIDVDATGNSITNLANANIKAAAGIEYSKLSIADADLTIAKTSGLQAALDAKQATITTDDLAITDISGLTTELADLSNNKQDTLIAGTNITITNNTISTTGGGGSTIDETTDVSLNNLFVHGDISANDASFNRIDVSEVYINGVDLINGAPEALDTLKELADALDNSANFAANVTNTLGSLQTDVANKQDALTTASDIQLSELFCSNITIVGSTISEYDTTNSIWNFIGSNDIYYQSGNVGIGTNVVNSALEVVGDVSFNGGLTLTGHFSGSDASFNVVDVSTIRIEGIDLGNSAPGSITVLSELATALDNSANLATEVTTKLGSLQTQVDTKQSTIDANTDLEISDIVCSTITIAGTNTSGTGSIYTWSVNSTDLYYTTGNVGIGTSTPTHPLHIASSETTDLSGTAYQYFNNTTSTTDNSGSNHTIGLRVENGIWCEDTLFVSSDRRIKENIVDVPDDLALQQLRNIPTRYYEYKDKTIRGSDQTIGFIAQEVNDVLPMAVSKQQQIIPDVMKIIQNPTWNHPEVEEPSSDDSQTSSTSPSTSSSPSTSTTSPSSSSTSFNIYHLTTNEPAIEDGDVSGVLFRFYVSKRSDGVDGVVKDVIGNPDKTFTFSYPWEHVFCYGRKVDDFHTIDKNKLFALNFSATQQIDRLQQAHNVEIQSQQQEIEHLKLFNIEANNQINQLQQENQQLRQEIATIKQHLNLN